MRTATIEPSETRTGRRDERVVTAYLAFLGILLAFGIDVALPAFDEIREAFDLDASGSAISLIGTFYFLGMAAGQLVYGPLSDRYGRIPALQVGLGLYALGALGAALAPSFEMLLATRLLWGLGAAGPAALRVAIARDLYSGDQMARVITIVMAVFLIGPIFVPMIGEGLIQTGSWQTVFIVAVGLAIVAVGSTIWFGETLAPEDRRPFAVRPILDASKVVLTTRVSIGNILAQTFGSAAFFIFLGSSQPVMDQIYGRADQFAFIFGAIGVVTVGFLLVNHRLIRYHGAAKMVMATMQVLLVANLVGLLAIVAWGGVPPFWVWLFWVTVASSLLTTATPMFSALALEPMGEIAGTASSILGFITLAGGALLAALVDSLISTSVTPMAVGYLGYGALALVALAWAQRSSSDNN